MCSVLPPYLAAAPPSRPCPSQGRRGTTQGSRGTQQASMVVRLVHRGPDGNKLHPTSFGSRRKHAGREGLCCAACHERPRQERTSTYSLPLSSASSSSASRRARTYGGRVRGSKTSACSGNGCSGAPTVNTSASTRFQGSGYKTSAEAQHT